MADPNSSVTAWAVFSAIGGSIIGGSISTVVAFVTQNRNLKAAKKQRDDDRFETRKGLAFSLFIKMSKIASNINVLRRYVVEPIAEAATNGDTNMLWRFVMPHANEFDRISFTPEEMAVLLSLDASLFTEIMPWADIHNSLLDVFGRYREKRDAFTNSLSAEMQGAVGTSSFTEEQWQQAAPRIAELDDLVEIMRTTSISDTLESWRLLNRLFERFRAAFKLQYTIGPNPLVSMPSRTAAAPATAQVS